MKRRAFLSLLAAVPVLLLPEIIVPRKTFFLPPRGSWRGDDTVYLQSLINEGLEIPYGSYVLSDTLYVNRSNYTMRNLHLIADERYMRNKLMLQMGNVENNLFDSLIFDSNATHEIAMLPPANIRIAGRVGFT